MRLQRIPYAHTSQSLIIDIPPSSKRHHGHDRGHYKNLNDVTKTTAVETIGDSSHLSWWEAFVSRFQMQMNCAVRCSEVTI